MSQYMNDEDANVAVSNYMEVGGLGDEVTLPRVAAAVAAYHGYKRNGSITWTIVWGLCGAFSPLITGAVAVAQGFGKRKGQ